MITRDDFHDLFYTRVMGYYRKLQRNGTYLSGYETGLKNIQVKHAFEPRHEETPHNFQRDRWHQKREQLVAMRTVDGYDSNPYRIVTAYNVKLDRMTIYKHGLELFGDDAQTAFDELKELGEKFFTVEVADRYPHNAVDISFNRTDNLMGVE